MSKDTIIIVRGILNYAKVLGKARPHTGLPKYDKGPLWSVDVTPDAKSRKLLKQHGLEGKLKEPSPKDSKRFLTGKDDTYLGLKVLLRRADGTDNKPPRVSDAQGNKWDEDTLIGNGSVGDLKIKVVDYGRGSDKGSYLQAIRVLKLIPYEGAGDFDPLDEDDEFFGAPEDEDEISAEESDAEDEDLDDDVPF